MYSVVIPTNRSFHHIEPLLQSLARQIFQPSQIVIVYDQYATSEEFEAYTDSVTTLFAGLKMTQLDIIHPLSDRRFKIGRWASYVRNYGAHQVTSPDMMYIDDDNTFDEYFMQKIFEYKNNKNYHPDRTLVVPLQYDDTTTFVRQAVADRFNFMLCRPRRVTNRLLESSDRYCPLVLSSSNCLVGSTSLFQQFPFDEEVPFVYEDLILTGQMSQAGIDIICDSWSSVIHAHGQRGVLAGLYINTPLRAYYKAKHRIFLIHTIGSFGDKVVFYAIGLPGQTGWLALHILVYAPIWDWFGLLWALVRGTVSGIRAVKGEVKGRKKGGKGI